MKFAIDTPNFDEFADPRLVADLAREAEAAGWDGYFIWDHIGADWPPPIADPIVELACMAMATQRIRIGAIVSPLPRRRPAKFAREVVTLDHLSGGRLVVGLGIGSDSGKEFSAYGESPDDKLHGEMLDEGLEILTGLWSGEKFNYEGKHYTIKDARFIPVPVQQPRPPVWLAGVWPNKKPFRRAARWDGVCPMGKEGMMTPGDIREMLAFVKQHRDPTAPFDVAFGGREYEKPEEEGLAMLREYENAGVTWWMESFDWTNKLSDVWDVVRKGPPRI